MANVKCFALAVAAVFIYATCARNALAHNASATNAAEKAAPAGPLKVALGTLEKSAYVAWKFKDAKFWDTFLSDKFRPRPSRGFGTRIGDTLCANLHEENIQNPTVPAVSPLGRAR
jgi:hypothetical protein